jgi:heme oxygenase
MAKHRHSAYRKDRHGTKLYIHYLADAVQHGQMSPDEAVEAELLNKGGNPLYNYYKNLEDSYRMYQSKQLA